jgi:hypothetical protein
VSKLHLRLGASLAAAGISACVTLPTPSVAVRPPVPVAAPFDETWTSALGELASQGIAVRFVDRDAGFIATESIALPVFSRNPDEWADCGTFASFRYAPAAVDYTLFVRGDSITSSLKTSARYRARSAANELLVDCVSTGAFERSFDASAKQRAETAQNMARQP